MDAKMPPLVHQSISVHPTSSIHTNPLVPLNKKGHLSRNVMASSQGMAYNSTKIKPGSVQSKERILS